MKAQTRGAITKSILSTLYNKERKNKIARDKDFKSIKRNRANVYRVRNDLIRKGIIKRVRTRGFSEYHLVSGNFQRREDILRCVNFMRSHDRMQMKTGAQRLDKIYNMDVISEAKDLDEFLQVTNLKALTEGKDVVEVTHVEQVWRLFIDALNDAEKSRWLLSELTDVIFAAVLLVKRYGNVDLLKMRLNGKVLDDSLHSSIQKAIFHFVGSEELYHMYKKIVIELFLILQELDDESKYLVSTIKELLRRISSNHARFSILSQPASDNLHPLGARRLPNLWYKTGDYSDLFKVIYRMLRNLGKERMRKLLLEWITDTDINLRFNAWPFLDCLLNRDSKVNRVSKN